MSETAEGDKPNTLDPVRVERYINEIEKHHESLLTERMSYMGRCRPIRENIGKVYELAAEFGIPKKILKAKIKQRDLERQIDGIPDDFEDDDRDLFEQVSQALGEYADTPLGKAATDAAVKASAKPKGSRKAPSAQTEPSREAGADSEAFKAGCAARQAGADDAIPAEVQGDDRDRWHNGWLAADRDMAKGADNAERLKIGIKGLPGADAPGKHTVQ